MPSLAVAILAAGKSTRMKSKTVKVLHPLAGVPIIHYVLSTAANIQPTRIVLVIGHGGQQIKDAIGPGPIYVEQGELLGTGHALL
jgi:bifunctional UDP-N-acetylglucosamine pyrophosphorylase/glucosamine-1-phosphate N-acetyltransferase